MRRTALVIALACPGCAVGPEFRSIFNGKDLTGWTCELPDCWSVEDGVLHARSDPEETGDILWTTERGYTDFVVRLEFRIGEGRVDSGVFLRGTDQIQLGDSGSMKRDMTALPYISGIGYPVQVETTPLLVPGGWNELRVAVAGSTYTTWLNATEVMTYESDTIAPAGPIGLQLHPNRQMHVSFRRIVVAVP